MTQGTDIERLSQLAALAEVPRPLDPKILGGLAISFVETDTLHLLQERLKDSFVKIGKDGTSEYGECIGYGVDMSPEDEQLVTKHLLSSTGAAGQGFTEIGNNNGVELLWTMPCGGKQVVLRRHRSPILLDNGDMVENATLFSLSARSANF